MRWLGHALQLQEADWWDEFLKQNWWGKVGKENQGRHGRHTACERWGGEEGYLEGRDKGFFTKDNRDKIKRPEMLNAFLNKYLKYKIVQLTV